jgi:hypothetical protein
LVASWCERVDSSDRLVLEAPKLGQMGEIQHCLFGCSYEATTQIGLHHLRVQGINVANKEPNCSWTICEVEGFSPSRRCDDGDSYCAWYRAVQPCSC